MAINKIFGNSLFFSPYPLFQEQSRDQKIANTQPRQSTSRPAEKKEDSGETKTLSRPQALPIEKARVMRLPPSEWAKIENRVYFLASTSFGDIDFIRAGDPQGKKILLIPGTPGQVFDFHKLIPLLAKMGFDVLALAPPTKGFSTRKDTFSFETGLDAYSEFLNSFLNDFGLDNVTLVAFSNGLAESVHNLPPSVERIVSISGWGPALLPEKFPEGADKTFTVPQFGPMAYSIGRQMGEFRKGVIEAFHRLRGKPELNQMVDEYLKGMPAGFTGQETPAERARLLKPIEWFCHPFKVAYDINGNLEVYYTQQQEERQKIKGKPMMFLVGEKDHTVRNAQEEFGVPYAKRMYSKILELNGLEGESKDSRFVFKVYEDSGHLLPYENAPELARDIDRFIRATGLGD